ncbi:MAG: DUF881 domain-containing protein [Patescibacteria group bacterium]|nr:DUF881 domain-containing protein [Patescibacteria group bacterium]
MQKLHIGKISKISIALIIIGIGIGLFFSAQWKTKQTRVSDPLSPYLSLQDTKDDLTREQESLKSEIDNLQDKIKEEESKLKKYNSNKDKLDELEKDRKLIGLTEIKGEGVVITMDDSNSLLSTGAESIAHAADLRDLTNFLWGLGAQAIEINNERVVFPTSIDCIVNTVMINLTKTTSPFTIKVVGNPSEISNQLKNENNLADLHKRIKEQGLIFEIKEEQNITIAPYNGSYNIEYAKIMN